MINALQGAPPLPDIAKTAASPAGEGAPAPAAPTAASASPKPDTSEPKPAADTGRNDLRLIIERAADHQAYVYKLVEPSTGQVVVELPRGQVRQMASNPDYAAGDLVSTSA